MWHLLTACEPAPKAVIITGEMTKEDLVMDNVKMFGTSKSNELDIHPALDFKSTVLNAGGK